MIKIFKEDSGIALIISLIVMFAIAIIAGAIIFETVSQYRLSSRNKAEMVAMNIAEAGVEYAIWNLETNSTFSGTGPIAIGEGTFSCTVANIPGFDNERLITVTGIAARYPAQRTVMVRVGIAYIDSSDWQGESPFGYAAFGKDKITNMTYTGGVLFDSYNSDTATYDASNWDSGDIRCNASIDLGGGATVNGDATPGPGGEVTIGGSSSVTGSTDPAETYAALVDIPSTETSKCTTSLSISGSTELTLGVPGETITYYFTSIKVTGTALLKIADGANVIIYVSGNVDISGNGCVNENPGDDATTLQLFAAGSSVKIGGSSSFCGVAYVPNGTVTLNGAQPYYGSFIGNKVVNTGGVAVHYDLAAQNLNVSWWETESGSTTGGVQTIVSWQRR